MKDGTPFPSSDYEMASKVEKNCRSMLEKK